jgi:hypothetical protein
LPNSNRILRHLGNLGNRTLLFWIVRFYFESYAVDKAAISKGLMCPSVKNHRCQYLRDLQRLQWCHWKSKGNFQWCQWKSRHWWFFLHGKARPILIASLAVDVCVCMYLG